MPKLLHGMLELLQPEYCRNPGITTWNAKIIVRILKLLHIMPELLQEFWNYYTECQNQCRDAEIIAHDAQNYYTNAGIICRMLKLLQKIPKLFFECWNYLQNPEVNAQNARIILRILELTYRAYHYPWNAEISFHIKILDMLKNNLDLCLQRK